MFWCAAVSQVGVHADRGEVDPPQLSSPHKGPDPGVDHLTTELSPQIVCVCARGWIGGSCMCVFA